MKKEIDSFLKDHAAKKLPDHRMRRSFETDESKDSPESFLLSKRNGRRSTEEFESTHSPGSFQEIWLQSFDDGSSVC